MFSISGVYISVIHSLTVSFFLVCLSLKMEEVIVQINKL